MGNKVKVVHIIVGLNAGGAEKMLLKLLSYTDRERFDLAVISMTDKSHYGSVIEDMGIPVHTLNMKRGFPSLKAIIKAKKIIEDVDIIQTWMYHADFLGYLLSKFYSNVKLIWGIRQSNLERRNNKLSTLILAKINSLLSKKTNAIISCSLKAKETHVKFGYDINKIEVIPNGFEIDKYYPEINGAQNLKKMFKIPQNKNILAHIARWDIQKDHENFFLALKEIIIKNPNTVALMCGLNIDYENIQLVNLIKKYKLDDYVMLLGVRDDIPFILSGVDVFVSSSSGEGFPNVIGEAMACETLCAVTDVGDSSFIVGNFGMVVPRKNPTALSKAILRILNMDVTEKETLKKNARKRVQENFEINTVVKKYESIYELLYR
ncbi:glycosyltransferase [Lysinibacillus irui]|uniref:glycosyltransferase n=1 Tax=Lysinibacillus irui TaxID=2998077 RepID=UPI0038892397